MHRFIQFFKQWLLPIAIVFGISLYLLYHFTTFLRPWGGILHVAASEGQRLVIALLLFFQFVQISPHDLGLKRWHLGALLFQVAGFLLCALGSALTPDGPLRILLECAMICLICPTAAAAGVITKKLDGDLPATMSYVVLVNVAATFLIPMVIPMIRPAADLGFWAYVGRIAWKIFPILILPGLLAWTIRYTTRRLQRVLMRWSRYTFYIWFFGLTLAMVLSTHALLVSRLGGGAIALIVLVSMASCAVQFFAGRRIGRRAAGGSSGAASYGSSRAASANGSSGDSGGSPGAAGGASGASDGQTAITAGQALGQKNTGFLIWLGYNYLTPVTSVAGGLYAIWQNLFNSWELLQHSRRASSEKH